MAFQLGKLLGAAITLFGTAVVAQGGGSVLWQSDELELDTRHQNVRGEQSDTTRGTIAVLCSGQSASYCGAGSETRGQGANEAAQIGETILEIRDWFDESGLLPSALNVQGPYQRQIWLRQGYVEGTTRARVTGGSRVSNMRLQVGSVLLSDDYMRADLAHEWFHTAAAADPQRRDRPPEAVRKLDEALAETVGLAFGFPGDSMIDPPPEPLKLEQPFFAEENTGYEKAPYFLFVGERLGATNRVAYIRAFMDRLADDGHAGLSLLYDQSLGEARFDQAYPEFVSRLNQPAGTSYFGEVPIETWDAGSASAPQAFSHDLVIAPNATTPLLADPITAQDLPQEPRDRLMVAELALEGAGGSAGDHLRLAFEHRLAQGNAHKWLMQLNEENTGPFLRVTNAGPSPDETTEQTARVAGRMQPIDFNLPECMNPGATRSVSVSGATLDGVGNFELRATAGAFDGLSFTAPDQPGAVEVTLAIDSPITRSSSLAVERRPEVEIPLGTVEVVARDCMIRMSTGAAVMTYSGERGGFTKMTTPQQPGMRIYIGNHDMVALIPGQGWMDVPPQMRQMFLRDMGNDLMLGDAVPGTPTTPFTMANFPRQMTRHLSWEHLRQESERLGIEPTITPSACPASVGGDGCVSVSAPEGALVYDRSRRLIELRAGPGTVTFEYGSFDISLPPNW